jgi:hypothetical protein
MRSGVAGMSEFALRKIAWKRSCRLIPSRFPPVEPYQPIAPSETWDALKAIELMTNPRLREVSARDYLWPEDRGVEQNWVVAPFAYPNPHPSRFSDGSFGYCIVAESDDGALADSVASREIFLRKTREPATKLDMRMLVTPLLTSLHDLAALDSAEPGKIRQAAISLREDKSYGLLLPSRTRSGESIAITLRPTAFAGAAVQSDHYSYIWDGERISQIYCYSDGRTIDPKDLITAKKRRAA